MLGRIGVVAVVASLDIALSQWSFEYIDVALYTITKSTSIVFILMFSLLFKLEKKHWSLIVIVLMISSGNSKINNQSLIIEQCFTFIYFLNDRSGYVYLQEF